MSLASTINGHLANIPKATRGALLVIATIAALAGPALAAPGPIVYPPPGMDRVKVRKDLVYQQGATANESLRFDVFLPEGNPPARAWPCVVLIHGGPISPQTRPKDWPAFDSFGRALAASGLAAL